MDVRYLVVLSVAKDLIVPTVVLSEAKDLIVPTVVLSVAKDLIVLFGLFGFYDVFQRV